MSSVKLTAKNTSNAITEIKCNDNGDIKIDDTNIITIKDYYIYNDLKYLRKMGYCFLLSASTTITTNDDNVFSLLNTSRTKKVYIYSISGILSENDNEAYQCMLRIQKISAHTGSVPLYINNLNFTSSITSDLETYFTPTSVTSISSTFIQKSINFSTTTSTEYIDYTDLFSEMIELGQNQGLNFKLVDTTATSPNLSFSINIKYLELPLSTYPNYPLTS
jgi:hypothetical protein